MQDTFNKLCFFFLPFFLFLSFQISPFLCCFRRDEKQNRKAKKKKYIKHELFKVNFFPFSYFPFFLYFYWLKNLRALMKKEVERRETRRKLQHLSISVILFMHKPTLVVVWWENAFNNWKLNQDFRNSFSISLFFLVFKGHWMKFI